MKRVLEIWRETVPQQRRTVVAAGLAAVLVVTLIAFQMLSASAGARDLTQMLTLERRLTDNGEALLQSLVTAESAQRTYLLTGATESMELAMEAVSHVQEDVEALLAAAEEAGVSLVEASRIGRLAQERTALIEESVALAQQGLQDQAIGIILGGRGDRLTAEVRTEVRRLLEQASLRREAARAERNRSELVSMSLQIVISLVGSIAMGLAVVSALHGRLVVQHTADELQQANAALLSARRDADEANATKSRFLAAASHDMRQPLHALSLYLASLERRVQATPEAVRIVASMNSAVRAMTRMFSALLDLARLEAGVLRPEPRPFPVEDLLANVMEQARELDPARPERIRWVRTRLEALSDMDLLEVVVRNLAVNAVKYAADGRVLVGCRRRGDDLRIEVHDTGPGIPEAQLHQLFGEFVRGEANRSVEGLGLGLSIVDRLSRLLGHRVEVGSAPGRGSVFTVTVPRAGGARRAEEASGEMSSLRGARVLLVDDEPLVLDAMGGALSDLGAQVRTAANGSAAVEAARAGVDLCILDLYLAGESGLDLLQQIEAALGGRVRCLFVTGSTASEALQSLRRSGRRWVTKPVPAHRLARIAAEILALPA